MQVRARDTFDALVFEEVSAKHLALVLLYVMINYRVIVVLHVLEHLLRHFTNQTAALRPGAQSFNNLDHLDFAVSVFLKDNSFVYLTVLSICVELELIDIVVIRHFFSIILLDQVQDLKLSCCEPDFIALIVFELIDHVLND